MNCTIGEQGVTSPAVLPLGEHTVECDATNTAGSDSESFTITVRAANQAPTGDAGGPYTVAEGDTLALDGSGSSDDDGDTLSYSWDVNGDGVYGEAFGDAPTLTWAQLVALGVDDGPGATDVTVRVSDGSATATSNAAQLSVANAAPTAGVAGAATGPLGQPVTLTLSASDPSPVDQAAGFDYAVDWGDGSTTAAVGGASLTRTHTYETVGTYTVTLTATDKDGATSAIASKNVTVSGVDTLADPCGDGSALVVVGTAAADNITVRAAKNGLLTVTLNGGALGTFLPPHNLIVQGEAGNDSISVDNTVTVQRLLYGGAGADRITGGNGAGVQVGGDGDDTLGTGNGRDILLGGNGLDRLNSGNGDDVLVAGPTAFDATTPAAREGLCALRKEWQRPDARFESRVTHLSGVAPDGLNGLHVLTTAGPARTALDDSHADALAGGKGQDWFLSNVAGGGVRDSSDAARTDAVTDL